MISDENETLEEFAQVPFACYKIITAVQNMGKLGKFLPQEQKTDMGDFMVGDPISLQLNIVDEDVTVVERVAGHADEYDLPVSVTPLPTLHVRSFYL